MLECILPSLWRVLLVLDGWHHTFDELAFDQIPKGHRKRTVARQIFLQGENFTFGCLEKMKLNFMIRSIISQTLNVIRNYFVFIKKQYDGQASAE